MTALLALGLAFATGVFGQSETRPQPETTTKTIGRVSGLADLDAAVFDDSITVLEIEVPVQVLLNGEPVRGLGRDNFEIYERGRRREIQSFRVIDLERERAAADGEPAARRNLLLIFDFWYGGRLLKEAAQGCRETLGRLHPQDRVAVVLLTRGGIRVLTGLTDRRDEVATAIEMVSARASGDPLRWARAASWLDDRVSQDLASRADRFGAAAALALPEQLSFAVDAGPGSRLLPPTFDWARQLAGSFDGEYLDPMQTMTRASSWDLSSVLSSMRHEAEVDLLEPWMLALERIAELFSDVGGIKHALLFSSGFDGSKLASHRATRYVQRPLSAFRRTGWRIEGISLLSFAFDTGGLFLLAHDTGGQLYENLAPSTEGMGGAFGSVLESSSVTYLMTFVAPDLKRNGRFHRIKVRLKDAPKRAKAFKRAGFSSPQPRHRQSELAQRIASASFLVDGEETRQLDVALLSRSRPVVDGAAELSIALDLRLPAVEMPQAAAERGIYSRNARVELLPLDEVGRPLDVFTVELGLRGEQARRSRSGEPVHLVGRLRLERSMPAELRLYVSDDASGRWTLRSVPLEVPEAGQAFLEPPLFLAPPGRPRVLGRPKGREASAVPLGESRSPFELGGRAVWPEASPVIESGDVRTVAIRYHRMPDASTIEARLLNAQGEVVAHNPLQIRARSAGGSETAELLGVFDSAGLPAGEYRLELVVSGASGGRLSSETRLRIVDARGDRTLAQDDAS